MVELNQTQRAPHPQGARRVRGEAQRPRRWNDTTELHSVSADDGIKAEETAERWRN